MHNIILQTNVWYLAFIPAKDERIFPNPEKFDPARWARDRPNPFATLPFGFGPRSCYGEQLCINHTMFDPPKSIGIQSKCCF